MEAGANIAGAYDASMENAGKQLGSTARNLENFQISLGNRWQPQFTAGVEAYSGVLKFLSSNVGAVAQVIETGLYVAIGLATTAVGRKPAATIFDTLASRAQAAQELQLAQAQAAYAEEAARKSIALREQANLPARAVQELDAAQAQQVLQNMEEPYKAAQDEARKYAAQIQYLVMQLEHHPGSKKADEWNRSLMPEATCPPSTRRLPSKKKKCAA